MAARKVAVSVVTPEGMVHSGLADMVVAPGTMGELGILPLHAPLLTTLKMGELRVRAEGEVLFFAIESGIMEVSEDRVTILTPFAEKSKGKVD